MVDKSNAYDQVIADLEGQRAEMDAMIAKLRAMADGQPIPPPSIVGGAIGEYRSWEDRTAPRNQWIPYSHQGLLLLMEIRGVVERLGDQEFSISHVEEILRKMGKGSETKHFKSRIWDCIRKLTREGVLTRTHMGVGRDPHRYRLAKEVPVTLATGTIERDHPVIEGPPLDELDEVKFV